jgi:transcriptional regulator with XRE-family HTH domain
MRNRTIDPLATVIRQLRTDAGMSQRELAEKSGVRLQTIGGWECGLTAPSLPAAREVLAVFGKAVGVVDCEATQ